MAHYAQVETMIVLSQKTRVPTVRSGLIAFALVLGAAACNRSYPPRNTGSDLIAFAKIDRAWALTKGSSTKVAVIDWQFDMRPRAAAKYVSPVSLVPGEAIGKMEPWHGEWMAEIIHQVAPETKIIPINARSLKRRGYQEFLVRGIRYAADHGAVAVTSSMGPTLQTPELLAAIAYAERRGTLFVDVHPEVLSGEGEKRRACSVRECDPRILRAGIVSVPQHPVQPDAPRDVYTWPYDLESNYKDGWGYSNAPPTIGGVVALMKSVNPSLTPGTVKALLVETAAARDGFRAMDAEAAVRAAIARRP